MMVIRLVGGTSLSFRYLELLIDRPIIYLVGIHFSIFQIFDNLFFFILRVDFCSALAVLFLDDKISFEEIVNLELSLFQICISLQCVMIW